MSAEILAADARRIKAMVEVDLATLRELVADDCRYVHSSAMMDTKASYLDKLERAVFRYTWVRCTEQQQIPVGDGLILSHRMEAELVMSGVKRPYASQAVAVWRSSAAGPRLVYFQATSLAAVPPA